MAAANAAVVTAKSVRANVLQHHAATAEVSAPRQNAAKTIRPTNTAGSYVSTKFSSSASVNGSRTTWINSKAAETSPKITYTTPPVAGESSGYTSSCECIRANTPCSVAARSAVRCSAWSGRPPRLERDGMSAARGLHSSRRLDDGVDVIVVRPRDLVANGLHLLDDGPLQHSSRHFDLRGACFVSRRRVEAGELLPRFIGNAMGPGRLSSMISDHPQYEQLRIVSFG